MLNSQRDREKESTGKFENPSPPSLQFPNGSHPVDLYVKGDNGKRADVLLNHQDVIEFIYVHKNILSKAFIVKRNTDFGTNVRTMTTVSGNCFDFTPFKVSDKILLVMSSFSSIIGQTIFSRQFRSVHSSPRVPTLPAKVCIPNFRGNSKKSVQPCGSLAIL